MNRHRSEITFCACGAEKRYRASCCRACYDANRGLATREVEFMRANVDSLSWRRIARQLGRNLITVKRWASRLGLAKSRPIVPAPRQVRAVRQTKAPRPAPQRPAPPTALETYENRVVRTEGCWGWLGTTSERGYAVFAYRGKKIKAHRFAYCQFIGPVPDGLLVCHHCDNPPCTNPAHLFTGTHRDNTADAVKKGRMGKKPKATA